MEDQKEILKLELHSQQNIVSLEKQASSQEVYLSRENQQLISDQFETQQQTTQQLITQTQIKSETFEDLSQKNENNEEIQQINQRMFESKKQEKEIITKISDQQQQTTSPQFFQQSKPLILDDSPTTKNSNADQEKTNKNERKKQKNNRVFPLPTQQESVTNYENQLQIKSQQSEQQNKSKKKWIYITLFLFVLVAIGLGIGLGLGLKGQDVDVEPKKTSEYLVQRKYNVNNSQQYIVQSKTKQTTIQKDGKQSITEIVNEQKVNVFCKSISENGAELLLYVDETRTYEVGKEDQAQIIPGIRNFLNNTEQRVLNNQNTQNSQMTQLSNHTFNTTQIEDSEDDNDNDDDNGNDDDKDDDDNFSKETIEMSTAEIVAFKTSMSGEILSIIYPVNLDPSFLFSLPKLLQTISPSVLKENYNIVNEKSGNKRILQEGKNVTMNSIEGDVVMSQMDKHDTDDGGVKLVQAYTQTTKNNYEQTTNSVEQTNFNEEGQLTSAEVSTTQKLGNPNNSNDLFNSIDLKQNLSVQFLQEVTITENEYDDVFSVYELMGKVEMEWNAFFKVLDKMRESDVKNTSLTEDEQKEQPLVDEDQQVDTQEPNGRLLSENGDILQTQNVELFSKSILSMPIKIFISLKCEKPPGPNEKDKCKTQLFLTFLKRNIPVSPVKEVNLPLTKFKNGINWFRKNVLLIVQDIKSTVFDEINKIQKTIVDKIETIENLFSKLDSPYLGKILFFLIQKRQINFQYLIKQDQLQEFIQALIQQLFSKVQTIESQILYEYGQLKEAMQTLVSEYEDTLEQSIQEYILKAKNFLTSFQSDIQNQINNIEDIIQSKNDMINSETLNEIKDLIQSIKNTKQMIIEEKLYNFTKEILTQIQNQLSSFVNQIINYFNLQQDFLEQSKDLISQEMKTKINQIIKTSLTTLLSKPFETFNKKFQEIMENTEKKLKSNIDLVKQDLDKKINGIESRVNLMEAKITDTSSDILQEIKEQKQYYEDILQQYTDDFTPDELIRRVQENFEKINYTLKEVVPGKVELISKIFLNLIQSLTSEFKTNMSSLKTKAKDISKDIISSIEGHASSIMSQFDGIQKQLEEQIENFYKILNVDFNSLDIQNNVKSQLNNAKIKLVDDPNDVPLPSNRRNLALGNLFDMSILSFVSDLKQLSTTSIQNIRNTVNYVTNLKNTFDEFSKTLNDKFVQPFEFSKLLELDLKFDGDLEGFINGEELLSLFKPMIDSYEQEFIKFLQTEIIESIQKSGIDLIKDLVQQLGDKLVKQLFDNTLTKLLDSNQLFELAITKISSLFKVTFQEGKLFEKHIKLPKKPQAYYIPTPIGIPLKLSYAFIFDATISYFLGIEGFGVQAGFNLSSEAILEASAALDVKIAQVGVVVQGHLLKADVKTQMNVSIYPKFSGVLKVNAKFKALSLYAAVYIQYIKIKFVRKCFRLNKHFRVLGWRRWRRAFRSIGKAFRSGFKFLHPIFNRIKRLKICIPIPKITLSEKKPILPPLNFQGVTYEKELLNKQIK